MKSPARLLRSSESPSNQKRREAPAFMPGMDRRWARRAQCPRAQQDLRSTRALNGRGHCIGGSPGIHAGEDVPGKMLSERFGLPIFPGILALGYVAWCLSELGYFA